MFFFFPLKRGLPLPGPVDHLFHYRQYCSLNLCYTLFGCVMSSTSNPFRAYPEREVSLVYPWLRRTGPIIQKFANLFPSFSHSYKYNFDGAALRLQRGAPVCNQNVPFGSHLISGGMCQSCIYLTFNSYRSR